MSKSSIKLQISYTALTAAVYIALAFFVHNQGLLLKISSIYCIPLIAFIEVLKFIFMKRSYKIQGHSVAVPKPGSSSILSESFKFAAMHLAVIGLFAFICIVLGAPPLSQFDATLTLSTLLTTLTLLPFGLLLGSRATIMLMVSNKLEMLSQIDEVYLRLLEKSATGVVLGAWAASVVMPLDWDRSWQVYPVPNIVGAAVGHVIGCLLAVLSTVFLDVRNELSKKIAF